MNKPLRRVAIACLLLFGLLMLNANYVQFVRADNVNNDAGNRRLLLSEYSRERGPILVAGQPVAQSVATPDDELEYLRQYPSGPLYAHVTGFYSFIFGAEGIERADREVLAGTDDRLFVDRISSVLTGEREKGGSVVLTLDPAAQQAALDGLSGQVGAVTALDPRTGSILAMVSNPSYDPNLLASHDANGITTAWDALNADPARPMLNRSLRESYPPGSTFKIITAAAALSDGDTPETEIYAPRVLEFEGIDYTLPNQNGASCAGDETATIREALRISCNTAFANLGVELGARTVREQAERFGFNSTVDVPMTSAESVFPGEPAEAGDDFDPDALNDPQLAQSSIGQLNVRATPLQMAMVIAGIANDGIVMRPYLVQERRAPDLTPLETVQPEQLSEAVTPEVAAALRDMLVTVVNDGTGRNAQIPGVTVGGKTGTAQTAPGQPPYAWFVAFAPAEDPQVAVAVLIEQADVAPDDISGGRLAAPIARSVMQAVLG